jgi:Holliday junction DNA helicase RuvB
MLESDRLVSMQPNASEEVFDRAIRPLSLDEYTHRY